MLYIQCILKIVIIACFYSICRFDTVCQEFIDCVLNVIFMFLFKMDYQLSYNNIKYKLCLIYNMSQNLIASKLLSGILKIWTPSVNNNSSLWESILQLNRNARIPKKPNHGARPCSHVMRR